MPFDEPFLGRQAVRAGLITDHQLRTRCRQLHRNVYIGRDTTVTASITARAAWLWAGAECVLCGISAAALLGTRWLEEGPPAEIIRRNRHHPPGIIVHSYELFPEDVCAVRGMRVTTAARTAFDIGRMMSAPRAIPILDALLGATRITHSDVLALADSRPGVRGVRRLRATLELTDGGAESPQETRVRLLLLAAGLPKPQTQIKFYDEYGEAYIRVDMGWPEWKVAVEYDGIQHWHDRRQRSWDIDRIAILESLGWVVIRVSAEMLSRPEIIVERVRRRLRATGCPV
jgi:very-short-patch-repair endonuclease